EADGPAEAKHVVDRTEEDQVAQQVEPCGEQEEEGELGAVGVESAGIPGVEGKRQRQDLDEDAREQSAGQHVADAEGAIRHQPADCLTPCRARSSSGAALGGNDWMTNDWTRSSVCGSRMLSPMIASTPRMSGNIASIALKASAEA